MQKKLILSLLLLALTAMAAAAPVKNMPTLRIQPDGDTLHCFVSGDEFFHRLHDAVGYTIVQNTATGQYVYADLQDGLLVPTSLVPGADDPAKSGLRPNLMPCKKELQRLHKLWDIPAQYQPVAPKTSGANHGTLNNIVIFIRFSDETSCTSTPFDSINEMFNDSSASAVSLYNYFWRSSYHNLRVITHYYPAPSGSTVLSFQDSHTRSYYEPYSSTNTNGYANDSIRRIREFTLLQNAVTWVNTNSPIPTTLNLDMDNDGCVDNICFVVSGTYTGWSDLLWPHKWSLYDRTVNINGKRVYTFNLQLAGSGSHYFGVSTFCHEMTHTLGAPDIYHYYDYDNVSAGGSWDLMNSNATPPQQTNSLFKIKYLNWFDSIPQLTDSGSYTMHSLASGPNHAYKIASPNSHQWYILEYRNTADTFDSSIPNRGMIIWRYNDLDDADNAGFDFFNTPHELWLFRPNSSDDTTAGSISSAAFGTSGRSSFSRTSNPHPYLCNGTADTSFSITNIQISSDYQSVSFTFSPNPAAGCQTVTSFPLTQDFEDADEGCWTFLSMDDANDNGVGVCSGSAHGGSYQFRFSSYYRATDYNQYLITPRLNASNPLHLKFYYKRSDYGTENFRVLYSTTNNSASSFTDTLGSYGTSSSSWQCCDLLVPQTARYVAINYYSNYQWYLYVDDIQLRDTLSTILHDTTYILQHDTVTTIIHDTVTHWVHDTVSHISHDTLYAHLYDTLYYSPHDTLFRIVRDTTFFTPRRATLTLLANEQDRGKVSGSGTFPVGTAVQIAAIPKRGYHFDHWSDGSTDNPRTFTLNESQTLQAFFTSGTVKRTLPEPTTYIHDTVVVHDTVWVTLHDTVHISRHDTIHLSYIDTLFITLRDTIRIALPQHDTVWINLIDSVRIDTTTYFNLVVRSNDESMGLAAGSGRFPWGTVVELGALANNGYRLLHWDDGTSDNPKTIILNSSQTITATFDTDNGEGINPAFKPSAKVYALDGSLFVETQEGNAIAVYNQLGQRVCFRPASGSAANSAATTARFDRLAKGCYAVKVGNEPAIKVIIY